MAINLSSKVTCALSKQVGLGVVDNDCLTTLLCAFKFALNMYIADMDE